MQKINVSFGGLSNMPDDGISPDGSMQVLMNLRHKSGELVPRCKPKELYDSGNVVKMAKIHHVNGHWLELRNKGAELVDTNDEKEVFIVQGMEDNPIADFVLMGNIVVMYHAEMIKYAIWRDGEYLYLGELPTPPDISVTFKDANGDNVKGDNVKLTAKTTTQNVYYADNITNEDVFDRYNLNVQKGFVDKCLNIVYKNKGYVDRVWFKVALKLFDGSYIAVSPITQVSTENQFLATELGGMIDNIGSWVNELWVDADGTKKSPYTATVKYFIPNVTVKPVSSKWKDIIQSVVLFSSGSIMSFEVKKESGEISSKSETRVTTLEYELYRNRTAEELKEAMLNVEFRKVAEYTLTGEEMWSIDNTSPSALAVQDVLTDIQVHDVLPKGPSYIYNLRLHLCNVITKFYHGGGVAFARSGTFSAGADVDVVVYIRTWNGDKKVRYRAKDIQCPEDLVAFFTYPDSRAYKMELYRSIDGYTRMISVPLIAHRTKNEAYYLKTVERTLDETSSPYATIVLPEWSVFEGDIPTADDTEEEPGVMRVSAVDNPFYFPNAQTYKFDTEIVALCSNAEAVSQGQFGVYPLYVFCNNGIWAMSVDNSGTGAYVVQSPFSREVCNGSAVPVSGGVVFTTDRGVMAISGGSVTELSAVLDYVAENMSAHSGGLYKKIMSLAGMDDSELSMEIRSYIKNARLAYNYLHDEVILSNNEYDFSLVYGLRTQSWSMTSECFDITTNAYPELVVYKGSKRLEFSDNEITLPVVAISRPMKFGTLDAKRMRQAALRCTFRGTLFFYILGSNDGVTFSVVTGCEAMPNNVFRDLVTSMCRSKMYRYFAVALASNEFTGRISFAELLFDTGFTKNRLR